MAASIITACHGGLDPPSPAGCHNYQEWLGQGSDDGGSEAAMTTLIKGSGLASYLVGDVPNCSISIFLKSLSASYSCASCCGVIVFSSLSLYFFFSSRACAW